jgi:chromosome segregation ATPase
MMKQPLLLVVCLGLSSACGLRRVPGNVLERLPYEAKIELLESENDLALAVDRLDEASNEVQRARVLLRRGKDRLDAAKAEVSNAQDELSKEVARLAVTEADMRVDWLRAKQRVNMREEGLAEHALECAHARYEQGKLASARKAKLEGIEKLDPEAFDAQVKRCDERHAELKERLKASDAEAEAVRAQWDEAKAALAKKTFDARASPYVE